MSWEPISKTLGSVIDERLSSPLISTFAISWSLINYKFFVILFSNNTVSMTFKLIDGLYPTKLDFYGWAIAAPFAATLVYIYWLPKLSLPVFERWRITQKENNAIRNRHPLEKVLSQEESWELQKKQLELESDLNSERVTVRTLRGDLDLATDKIDELEAYKKSVDKVKEEWNEMRTKLHAVTSELKEVELRENASSNRLAVYAAAFQRLLEHVEKDGGDVAKIILGGQIKSLRGLVSQKLELDNRPEALQRVTLNQLYEMGILKRKDSQ